VINVLSYIIKCNGENNNGCLFLQQMEEKFSITHALHVKCEKMPDFACVHEKQVQQKLSQYQLP